MSLQPRPLRPQMRRLPFPAPPRFAPAPGSSPALPAPTPTPSPFAPHPLSLSPFQFLVARSQQRQATYTSPPPACHYETLLCLNGVVPMPSEFLVHPGAVYPGPKCLFGSWLANDSLATLKESLLEYRERVLSADEQRVARPVEIRRAMYRERLLEMRVIWALRLAEERKAVAAARAPAPAPALALSAAQRRLAGATASMRALAAAAARAVPDADANTDADAAVAAPGPRPTPMLRVTNRPPPPRSAYLHTVRILPANAEAFYDCDCTAHGNKCQYCSEASVRQAVYENVI